MSTSSKISVAASGLTGLVGSRVKQLTADIFNWINFSPSTGTDITQSGQIEEIIAKSESSAFVNFSGFTDIPAAQTQQGDQAGSCYRLNVIGPKNLSRACKKFRKHLIHLSTDAVFDGQKPKPYIETDQPHPISWYGLTKLWGEQEILASGCESTIARIAYPFRAEFKPKADFVRKIISQLSQNRTVSMFTDTRFTPTFVDDIAVAIKAIILNQATGIFHCVGSSIISPFAAAQDIAAAFHFNPNLILKTHNHSYPPNAGFLNHKATSQLGVKFLTFPQALDQFQHQLNLK